MDLNPRQVSAFRAVMMTGSMTAAAEALHITQPAISRLIRDFELRLELQLFKRRGSHLIPTHEAIALHEEVERSFVGLDRIASLAQSLKAQTTGSLRIAALPGLASSALPGYVAQFTRNRGRLRVAIMGMPSHLVIEAVASGLVDIGYANGPSERPGLLAEPISLAAVAIVPTGHPLEAKAVIKPMDFQNERFISLAQGDDLRARIDTALADIPRILMIETTMSLIACMMVCHSAGVSIVDPATALQFVGRGLVIKPFALHIESGFVALLPTHRAASPISRSFMSGLVDHIASLPVY